ncbi:DUF2442 domain-containing protein [Kaistia algarum]|uniref:DUF2442 domain-containing protein n=1 Tax=Kaistia algarum TaxID=2083279 RepID=UPI001A9C2F2D|nr:DUF2442 domain-containing protein [Kaistia algarum]MCX5513479.1 DUF2442 domain-containing protein [Kaistia algarum]
MTDETILPDPRAVDIFVTEDMLLVGLADGRELSIPLAWSSKLLAAGEAARAGGQIVQNGTVLHWPAIDETIVVASLLRLS